MKLYYKNIDLKDSIISGYVDQIAGMIEDVE